MTKKPDPKLVELARLVRQLETLRKQQAATQAEMIRACVTQMGIDVNSYRMRGHETYSEKMTQTKENKRLKAQAPLYLLALATQLENFAASGNLTLSSIEGD